MRGGRRETNEDGKELRSNAGGSQVRRLRGVETAKMQVCKTAGFVVGLLSSADLRILPDPRE
jgi:hypothetical protein